MQLHFRFREQTVRVLQETTLCKYLNNLVLRQNYSSAKAYHHRYLR